MLPPSPRPSLPATLVGCSSKSYFDAEQATRWGPDVVDGVADDPAGTDGLFICPSFPLIPALLAGFAAAGGLVGAQDVSVHPSGPYTGEVSAEVLAQLGVRLVMAGHPERRRLFGETDQTVNRKLMAALGVSLTPIVCIGETLEEREANQTLAVLDRQIKDGLDSLIGDQVGALVIAYEPVWAIGTGRNATPEQAGEAHAHIRSRLKQWFGPDAADHCHVIYGGGVKPDNIHDLIVLPDVDGALVGGASLDVRAFTDIVARSRPGAV